MNAILPNTPFNSFGIIKAFNESPAGIGCRTQAGRIRLIFAFDRGWTKICSKFRLSSTLTLLDYSGNPWPSAPCWQILSLPAASDSISILLECALFLLARKPSVWHDLYATVLEIGLQPLTYDVLRSLLSLRHPLVVIGLQGPIGHIFHSVLRDTILPVGGGPEGQSPILVRKSTMVVLNISITTRISGVRTPVNSGLSAGSAGK